MRILFTIPNFETAGSGHALFQLAHGLKHRGFDVHIMTKHDRGVLISQILENGIALHIYPYESPKRPFSLLLRNCWNTSRKLREIAPDIIYSYHYSADYSEPLAAWIAGIPWVYVKKNMSWYGPSKNAWYVRSLLARRINVQNTEMEKEFLSSFSKKLVRIPIGVDTNHFKPQALPKEQKFTFVHISTLLPVKGVEILLKAYKLFCERISENTHQLWVVGPDQDAYVEQLKREYAHNRHIIFTGKRSDVPIVLNKAHCFIQSSLNEGRREGAPIALQEAMACGLPCIGSKVAGVNDQMAGFEYMQYESINATELCSVMLNVYNMSPENRQTLGMAMREMVQKEYSLQSEIQKTDALLKSLVRNI